MNRLWRALINSWNGLKATTRSEEAFRQELLLLGIAVPLAFWITQDIGKRYMLIGTVILMLVVELLNTAIEKLGDRITREHDETIGRVKDMGSAAVGVSLVFAAAVWLWLIGERFWP